MDRGTLKSAKETTFPGEENVSEGTSEGRIEV